MERISKLIWPRPVVIITTIDKNGKPNGMTASFISPISFNPMYLGFALSPRRYTYELLKETKEFGVCVLEENQANLAWIFGTKSGREVNKFELTKVKIIKPKYIKAPLIDCPIAFECKLEDMKLYGDHYWVVGKVLYTHIKKKDFRPLLHYSGNLFPTLAERDKWIEIK